jgi:hypothetical protein
VKPLLRVSASLWLTGIVLAGCAEPARLYTGPDRPYTRIARLCCATINLTGGLVGKHLQIESVDGRKPAWMTSWLELAPGPHRVGFAYLEGIGARPTPILPYGTTPGTLSFEAKPGRDYEIKAADEPDGLYVWIEDQASHEVAGGSRPKDR